MGYLRESVVLLTQHHYFQFLCSTRIANHWGRLTRKVMDCSIHAGAEDDATALGNLLQQTHLEQGLDQVTPVSRALPRDTALSLWLSNHFGTAYF